jgi:hypothetical protein
VFISQAGSSVGNVSILAPFCVAVVLVMVYYAQVCGVARVKKTYTSGEKDDALQDLALKLLVVRDCDKATVERESVLAKLVEELGSDKLNQADVHYREDDRLKETATIDWAALQMRVGLKKRAPSAATSPTRTEKSPSVASVSDNAGFATEPGVELHPVTSPIHFVDLDGAPSALAVVAAKNKYVIMNDYEVTPALFQVCASKKHSLTLVHRKVSLEAASGCHDSVDNHMDGMEAGEGGTRASAKQDRAGLDVDALLSLIDDLIASFEAAEQDRTKSVWAVVSQTAILRTVNVAALPKDRLSGLYYKLNVLLALHAAVMLNVPLSKIKQHQASGVAYIVGMEVLTLAEIRARL